MTWAADTGITLDHARRRAARRAARLGASAPRSPPGGCGRATGCPALRELADELGVNHNTLRAAVAKLEADGLLESRHGSGHVRRGRRAPRTSATRRSSSRSSAGRPTPALSPRELAAALYVADAPAPPERDAAAEERRALRDEIAVLERRASPQLEDAAAARSASPSERAARAARRAPAHRRRPARAARRARAPARAPRSAALDGETERGRSRRRRRRAGPQAAPRHGPAPAADVARVGARLAARRRRALRPVRG